MIKWGRFVGSLINSFMSRCWAISWVYRGYIYRWFVGSFASSFVGSFVSSFVGSVMGSLVDNFVGSFTGFFWGSFVGNFGHFGSLMGIFAS